ncbi:hypothetical protein TNCV_3923571 [Trichonephila clavipes]|nr:hypothetical protein TNCV_3923571 [Trichonephila clavipes]
MENLSRGLSSRHQVRWSIYVTRYLEGSLSEIMILRRLIKSTEVPNSPRAVEFWAFNLRSATFNTHTPVHWKHLRYRISPSVESRVLELVSVHL